MLAQNACHSHQVGYNGGVAQRYRALHPNRSDDAAVEGAIAPGKPLGDARIRLRLTIALGCIAFGLVACGADEDFSPVGLGGSGGSAGNKGTVGSAANR